MRIRRRTIGVAAAIGTLGAGGAAIAYGVGGDSSEQVTGPNAERAESAALEAAGGGTVTSIERADGDGSGVYEVEVRRADGSQVEVAVDDRFQALGNTPDDDGATGPDADASEGD